MKKLFFAFTLICVCSIWACGNDDPITQNDPTPPPSTDTIVTTDTTDIDPPQPEKITFFKGADISWVTEMEDQGRRFYNNKGNIRECTALMQELGLNAIRLRVWVNPSDGYCNKEDVLKKALRATRLGMPVMIDFHYSDSWADPSKQYIPSAWSGHNFSQIIEDVKTHTTDVLQYLKENGVTPRWVQIGNETANGLLWDIGKADKNPQQYAKIITAGYDAVKSIMPETQVIVHIDRGHNRSLLDWNLGLLKKYGAQWDITGLSLYPYSAYGDYILGNDGQAISPDVAISRCISNISYVYKKFGTEVIIVETGMQVGNPAEGKTLLSQLIKKCKEETEGHCLGVFYWEPQSSSDWKNYQLGAFNNNGTPTSIMDAFAE